MILQSNYNDALVQAVEHTGEPTTLSWELQHSLCAAAGRATPGSDLSADRIAGASWLSGAQDKSCAYSAADNHVVTNECNWAGQEFTRVSGSLDGVVGYMCATGGSVPVGDCGKQVRVANRPHPWSSLQVRGGYQQVTLNSGDAVFCSA